MSDRPNCGRFPGSTLHRAFIVHRTAAYYPASQSSFKVRTVCCAAERLTRCGPMNFERRVAGQALPSGDCNVEILKSCRTIYHSPIERTRS